MKGYPFNSGIFKKGHIVSAEMRQKIRLGNLGKKKPHSEEHKRKLSETHKGKKHSEETKEKIRKINLGKKLTIKHRKNISKSHKQSVSNGTWHTWKGGVTPINLKIRDSLEYRLWREAVFKRDNYTCVWCKQRGGKLNADHIKRFSDYPALRLAIDNGRTLCITCHRTTDTYGYKNK